MCGQTLTCRRQAHDVPRVVIVAWGGAKMVPYWLVFGRDFVNNRSKNHLSVLLLTRCGSVFI